MYTTDLFVVCLAKCITFVITGPQTWNMKLKNLFKLNWVQQFVQEWFDDQAEQINFAQVLYRSGIIIFRLLLKKNCYWKSRKRTITKCFLMSF